MADFTAQHLFTSALAQQGDADDYAPQMLFATDVAQQSTPDGILAQHLFAYGNPDTTPPVVFGFVPPDASAIARAATLQFDVTDDSGSFGIIVVAVEYATGRIDVVHNGAIFSGGYAGTRTVIADGYRYVVGRSGLGWLGDGALKVFAVDAAGNLLTGSAQAFTVTDPLGAPTVGNFNPAPASTIDNADAVAFDVTDVASLDDVFALAEHSTGRIEVVGRPGAFVAPYATLSTNTPITNGMTISVERDGGWPAPGLVLRIFAYDTEGNSVETTYALTVSNPTDASAPAVSNVQPPAGTPIARNSPLFFDVTDDSGSFRRIIVTADFSSGAVEVVHDGDGFARGYEAGVRSVIPGGFRYRVQRAGGWPNGPTIRAVAIDPQGNEN